MTKSLLALFLLLCSSADANPEKNGWLREKVKSRWIQKQSALAAPTASNDVTSKITKAGDLVFSFKHDSVMRYYRVHIPKAYNPAQATPLVLALHGAGGDMNYPAEGDNYRLIAKSESAGFILVLPNGSSHFKSGKFAAWNAGACCAYARDKQTNDVDFLREVIRNVKNQLNIDSNKVFATGMSNGAMMSYRLACEMPETIKAIAPVAGTDNTLVCDPKNGTPVLHIHARNDESVLFGGGAGPSSVDKALVTDYKSVPATIEKWRTINKCRPTTKKILEKDGAFCELTTDCKSGAAVQLCVTESGGHTWPGSLKPGRRGEAPSTALSATDLMWDFFSTR